MSSVGNNSYNPSWSDFINFKIKGKCRCYGSLQTHTGVFPDYNRKLVCVCRLLSYMIWTVCKGDSNLPWATGDWVKINTPVVNTKWPWHLSILSWIPGSPVTVHTCMRVLQKSASTNLSRGLCMMKPASRKTIWPIWKYSTVTLDTNEELRFIFNVRCIQTHK